MKTKKETINVISLGCSKNLVDSEVLLKQIEDAGYSISHNSTDINHDTVVINTCGFINDARQESIDTILNVVSAGKHGRIKKIIVMGCLSARYKEELKKEIPEVDAFFGVNSWKEILEFLGKDYKKELTGERILTTPPHYAYLKIAEGCDRKCSFCAIPLIRGKHVSKTIGDILKEASLLAEKGVKEIILIAQDLTYYGVDIYKKRKLAHLLEKLSAIKGLEWIRLQYAYPAAFPADILPVIREHKNICNYLDIPFQHISDRLLSSMDRGIDKKKTYQLTEKIRKEIPGVALRTSLIVGYPGETKNDFEELTAFISEVKFDRLGVFRYSHEESTKAYLLKDNISDKLKQERMDRLMDIQHDISLEKNNALIGKTLKVIFDRKEGDFFAGRTEFDSPEVDNGVLVKAGGNANITGQFKNVRITGAEAYDIFGEIFK